MCPVKNGGITLRASPFLVSGRSEDNGSGGIRDVTIIEPTETQELISRLQGIFLSSSDPTARGYIIGVLREALEDMEEIGNWNEPDKPDFWGVQIERLHSTKTQ